MNFFYRFAILANRILVMCNVSISLIFFVMCYFFYRDYSAMTPAVWKMNKFYHNICFNLILPTEQNAVHTRGSCYIHRRGKSCKLKLKWQLELELQFRKFFKFWILVSSSSSCALPVSFKFDSSTSSTFQLSLEPIHMYKIWKFQSLISQSSVSETWLKYQN